MKLSELINITSLNIRVSDGATEYYEGYSKDIFGKVDKDILQRDVDSIESDIEYFNGPEIIVIKITDKTA